MEHYLDNSSTTKPSEAAKNAAMAAMDVWGNPSSIHSLGQTASRLLTESRTKVGSALGMARFSRDKVIFTSSGTEANCLAMLGCAASKKRTAKNGYLGKIIISDSEHPSMENPAKKLENEGYLVKRISTVGGILDLEALKTALSEDDIPVIFAGFMLVNNETGAIYDIKSAAALVKAANPAAVVHCDAVQGFMKMKFTPSAMGVDTLSVSAHKIHGLRGAAALYLSEDILKKRNITAVNPGGGQEDGLRSGTENLVSIAAFAAACEAEKASLDTNIAHVTALRDYLEERLSPFVEAGEVVINRPLGNYLPNICNISVKGVRSEVMLNHLSQTGVYVSAGSACSAHAKKQSQALTAFGLDKTAIESAVRISMSHENTAGDIDALTDGIGSGLARLKRR
ncbi:MAG: cysteine desulfurase [Ruminococcaceae bacterium]|nr:cysteine desulfurase [Oscillospiraceae bacterium]